MRILKRIAAFLRVDSYLGRRRAKYAREIIDLALPRHIRRAEEVRAVALAPLRRAIKAGDTRAQHHTFGPAHTATCAALRAATGPAGWRGK